VGDVWGNEGQGYWITALEAVIFGLIIGSQNRLKIYFVP